MNRIIAIIFVIFLSVNLSAQTKEVRRKYVGTWVSENSAVKTYITKNKKGLLEIIERDTLANVTLETVYLRFNEDGNLVTKTVFPLNNYVAITEFVLTNNDEITAYISAKHGGMIKMRKVKN